MRMNEPNIPFIQLPCAVIDEILPTLRDTELRLLLVVLRQTWGWRNPDGKSKERDWLSHLQLKERTGRASEAVCAAIDVLVKRGLVTVQNEQGETLGETHKRQRVHGRLYFQPGPLLAPLSLKPLKTSKAKAKTTKQAIGYISCRFRNPDILEKTDGSPLTAETQARVEAVKQAIRERLKKAVT